MSKAQSFDRYGSMNEKIEKAFQWRYATKAYDSTRQISEKDWETLKQSLVMSPSSYGIQPWKFLDVQNKEIREKLRPVSWGQSQVTDASRYIVFTTKEHMTQDDVTLYIKRIAEVRGVTTESLQGYYDLMNKNLVHGKGDIHWSQRQSYIAMGFLLETAALLNIDATPIEGIDPLAYDEILGLKGTGWRTVATVALGYRSKEDKYQHAPKVRFPTNEIIETV